MAKKVELAVIEKELGNWYKSYQDEMYKLKGIVEYDFGRVGCIWKEDMFPDVGCIEIPQQGEKHWQIYAYFDTFDSHDIIRKSELGLINDDKLMPACCQCLLSQEEEEKYYPNLDLLCTLCYKGNIGSSEFGRKENCSYSPKLCVNSIKKSMKKYDMMTLHEIKMMVNNFNIKLLGHHRFIDVDTGMEGEFIGRGFKETRKLPDGWFKDLNRKKNKFYYWKKGDKESTWKNPLNAENKITDLTEWSDEHYKVITDRSFRIDTLRF